MVEMRHAYVRGVLLNAFPDQREGFLEWFSMEQKPGHAQMISVAEG
jgi:hypothetical protein